ncbi:MAG TPA: dihydrofolate reductase family protein [Pseudonocardiaceae bacterium]|nr:dihydrofolate reductase family protein [Pseudonocardiaceae bacterium]
MRELRVDMFSTVDGFSGPGPSRAPFWGFGGPELDEWINAQLAEDHIMLMGANTYRQMAEIVAAGHAGPPRMAELPKIVFSKTITPPLTWENSTVIADPVETAVLALKQSEDNLPMRTIGSASLVRSLIRLGLVDRLRIMVFPMVHGIEGEEPAFAELPSLNLTLVNSMTLDERLVLLDYRVNH